MAGWFGKVCVCGSIVGRLTIELRSVFSLGFEDWSDMVMLGFSGVSHSHKV